MPSAQSKRKLALLQPQKSRLRRPLRIIAAGVGSYARTLVEILGAEHVMLDEDKSKCAPVSFKAEDGDRCAIVVVLSASDGGSTVVRYHRAIWKTVPVRQAIWLIVTENQDQANEICHQDVYGRTTGAESFGSWHKCYGIIPRIDGLRMILEGMTHLKPILRSTWQRCDTGAQTVDELLRRIEAAITHKPSASSRELMEDLPALHWECFCDHPQANKIRRWMARDKKCTAWLSEGRTLLAELVAG
jgi:hypothetical protein